MTLHMLLVIVAVTLLFIIAKLVIKTRKEAWKMHLPPGPPGKPFIGNLFDIPPTFHFLKLQELAKTYGPLLRISVFGKDTFVISSFKVANDLLRDRGAIYTSRPVLPAATILLSNNKFPILLPSDPAYPEKTSVWRKGRKFGHQILGASSVPKYSKTHDLESSKLIQDLILSPSDYDRLFERYAASIIFRLAYGKPIETSKEYYNEKSVEILKVFEHAITPGSYLVDFFPSLLKLPTFLAPFKKYLLTKRDEANAFYLELQDMVRREMQAGFAPPSFTKTFLENQSVIGMKDEEGAHLLAALYAAGTGTTSALLSTFVLKIVHHPDWQKRLQEEIDREVGTERVPSFNDFPKLPTLRAVVKEVLRLYTQGIPRKLIRDDNYEEFHLPAGTTVFPNIWAINRDPTLYPDPETFNPERWLSPAFPTYREPLTKYPNLQNFAAFGFGRRICPGMNLAERSLNIAAARLTWACQISKKKTSDGQVIEVPIFDFTSDLISRPKPFQFELKARSQQHLHVLQQHLAEAKRADPLREHATYELEKE